VHYSNLLFLYSDCRVLHPTDLGEFERSDQHFVLGKTEPKRVPRDDWVKHKPVHGVYRCKKGFSVLYVRLYRGRVG